nr:MAG TPA: hypothetical protein [Caudoviricetes sp.]
MVIHHCSSAFIIVHLCYEQSKANQIVRER